MISLDSLHTPVRLAKAAIKQQRPILIVGPPGSGKTALIRYLTAQNKRFDAPAFLRIQINEGIDSKVIT